MDDDPGVPLCAPPAKLPTARPVGIAATLALRFSKYAQKNASNPFNLQLETRYRGGIE